MEFFRDLEYEKKKEFIRISYFLKYFLLFDVISVEG